MRLTGDAFERAVVCVNGGAAREAAGTWSASLEWLVGLLAPGFPGLGLAALRSRLKSWKRLHLCVEHGLAAIETAVAAGAREIALLAFSMGGAVSLGAASHPAVSTVIGLAPWFPDRLAVSGLDGRRLAVFHGALDRYLPGIPGVHPRTSHRGYERAPARRVPAAQALIPPPLHPLPVP